MVFINKVIKLFYIRSFIVTLIGSIQSPIFITYKGTLFSTSDLAWLMSIGSFVGIFQFTMNKLDKKITLIITPYLGLMLSLFLIVMAFVNLKVMIMIDMTILPVVMLIFFHYTGVVGELIKNEVEIQKYSNNLNSLASAGGLIGYLVSGILTKYYDPFYVLVGSMVLYTSCDIIEFYITCILRKKI